MNSGHQIRVRAPIARPAFARWCWERDLKLKEVGDDIGCSYEQVRLICLPFNDPKRRTPDELLIRRIYEYTGGEISVTHWYPAELHPVAVDRGGEPGILAGARAS